MADKKKTGARFTLPSEEDLDKSLEKIRSGSTFLSRIRAAKNDEKNLGQPSLLGVGVTSSHSDKPDEKQQVSKGKGKESDGVSACKLSRLKANKELKDVERTAEFPEEEAKSSTDKSLLATKSLSDDSKSELPVRGKNSEEESNLPNKAKVDVPVPAAIKMSTNSIIVNARQRGNPILKHIRNVPWEYGEIIPDYVLGQTTCALFLSLRYHNFNPEYIHDRLKQLGHRFELRILLVQVDVKDPHASLKELSKMCILADCTLILAWSTEEAGRYLETYKSYENKPADVLQEKVDGDYQSKMIDCLTSVKSVNKTDAVTLMSNFGSLKNILQASKDEISLCPGFGPQKAERLVKLCNEPFIKKNRSHKEETNNQIGS